MTKHLKDMTLDELKAGYEKGKVTDEEIEQNKQWLKDRNKITSEQIDEMGEHYGE